MSAPVAISMRSIVLDCPDPPALATFYADLLQGRADTTDPDWCEVHTDDATWKLAFQRADPYEAPDWPNGSPQQLHLDLSVSDLDAACRRAAELGAVALGDPVQEPACVFVVFADPAGHPFCLCQER